MMKAMRRADRNHHHPQVKKDNHRWMARCSCGWCNWNTSNNWRVAIIAALSHSERVK
jgi:acetone carboxylase gamma subunit